MINVFLGWTLLGWVVALAMAARSMPPRTPESAEWRPEYGGKRYRRP